MKSLVQRSVVIGRSMMLAAVLALAGLWSGPAGAAKTDIVILINGDRITGEVKGLERGVLRYSTDFMGALNIEWDKIAQLRSNQLMEVETLDSKRYLGRPSRFDESGGLRLEGDQGKPIHVPLNNVARIFALDAGKLRDRLDGYVNVGWSAAAANNLSQLSVGAGLTYVDEVRLWDFTYEASRSES